MGVAARAYQNSKRFEDADMMGIAALTVPGTTVPAYQKLKGSGDAWMMEIAARAYQKLKGFEDVLDDGNCCAGLPELEGT